MKLNLMRYCNLFDPITIGRMTVKEYLLRMKAANLQRLDREYEIHLLAWQMNQAGATKQKGKKTVPYFSKFSEFFDYEQREKDIIQPVKKEKRSSFEQLVLRANSIRKEETHG